MDHLPGKVQQRAKNSNVHLRSDLGPYCGLGSCIQLRQWVHAAAASVRALVINVQLGPWVSQLSPCAPVAIKLICPHEVCCMQQIEAHDKANPVLLSQCCYQTLVQPSIQLCRYAAASCQAPQKQPPLTLSSSAAATTVCTRTMIGLSSCCRRCHSMSQRVCASMAAALEVR